MTTEHQKVRAMMGEFSLGPAYHIQAYARPPEDGNVVFAICKTKDILAYIDQGEAGEPRKTGAGQYGQAWFYPVWWERFDQLGYWRIEYPRDYDRQAEKVRRNAATPETGDLFSRDHYQFHRRG